MIPLMIQENYKAKGWLGLLLGTRLWYPFFGSESDDDGPGRPGAVKRSSRFPMKTHFVWGFCVGAHGA